MTTQLDLLKQTIDRSNEQGQVISEIVTEMLELKTEMTSLYEDIREEFEEFRKTIPLSGPEADRLKILAQKKAYELTTTYFNKKVSDELFSKKYGHIISGVYTAIRSHFEVSKYNQVRHKEAARAFDFVKNLKIDDLKPNYLRLTDVQYEISLKHDDDIPQDFRGAHQKVLELI